jgi:hypothetical protein
MVPPLTKVPPFRVKTAVSIFGLSEKEKEGKWLRG